MAQREIKARTDTRSSKEIALAAVTHAKEVAEVVQAFRTVSIISHYHMIAEQETAIKLVEEIKGKKIDELMEEDIDDLIELLKLSNKAQSYIPEEKMREIGRKTIAQFGPPREGKSANSAGFEFYGQQILAYLDDLKKQAALEAEQAMSAWQ